MSRHQQHVALKEHSVIASCFTSPISIDIHESIIIISRMLIMLRWQIVHYSV